MKQLFLISILSFFTLGFTTTDNHAIYVSLAEVEYFTKKREVQVSLRVFTDDLEAAIRKNGKRLNLDTSKEIKNAGIHINEYLNKYFKIKANDKYNLTAEYTGKEYVDDMTWVYFNYTKTPKRIKKIAIKNTIIVKLHAQQKNLVHFRKDRVLIDSKHLTKKRSTMTLNLK